MTARFKDFGTGVDDQQVSDPISFKLYGEEFSCNPKIQGSVMLRLIADSASQDASKSAAIVTDFFNKVLTEESKARFNALVESPDKIVSIDTLADITSWLVEEYSSRPTEQPSVS
jgi:hypothetical protein